MIKIKIKKIWENESDFLILHIKISLCGNFHENPKMKNLTYFLNHFRLIGEKLKMKMKKFGKN